MTPKKFLHIPYLWPVGKGGMVSPERVVAVGRWVSAPIRRAVRLAKAQARLIDLTYGEACIWVIFLDSGHLVLATEPMPMAVCDIDPDDVPPWDEKPVW